MRPAFGKWIQDAAVADGWYLLNEEGVSVAVIYPLARDSIVWSVNLFRKQAQWPPTVDTVMVSTDVEDVMEFSQARLVRAGICRDEFAALHIKS